MALGGLGLMLALRGGSIVRGTLASGSAFTGQTAVEVRAGDRLSLYTEVPPAPSGSTGGAPTAPGSTRGTYDPAAAGRAAEAARACTLTHSEGAGFERGETGTYTTTRHGQSFEARGSYRATANGTVTAACTDGKQHLLAEPLEVKGVMGLVGGLGTGVFGIGLGALIAIVGIVLVCAGGNRRRG